MPGKIRSRDEIIAQFKDGQTVMCGGMHNHGTPNALIQCVIDSGARHLTVISIDSADANLTLGRLFHHRLVDKIITSYIGRNTEVVAMLEAGEIEVEFVPQGSLVERVRCGGAGLGGVLTKTGLGTVVEEGRQIVEVNGTGEKYLLETALRADIGLVRARMADPLGNLAYRGTMRNFNPLIATAADLTLVDADMLMDVDEIGIDRIGTPGVYVDMVLAK
ncbi:CoA transferase subunit A [Telmatospirillum siberiense]|uniref:Branched-chain amino acid dehydrogenase n=1 Tax=Telmatospirillum siberiense TaxID=382514 RepID=A0A2N3Q0C4_9PROT|nr:CoA transferase subunit A [Telmatospirillum siberiense]PKU26107.1 branched-chain amino acid dehydrogenase [Telmatospirillum siberiense]